MQIGQFLLSPGLAPTVMRNWLMIPLKRTHYEIVHRTCL